MPRTSSREERFQRGAAAPEGGKYFGDQIEELPVQYARNDQGIKEDIQEEFDARVGFIPDQITVTVEDGEVTLEGLVPNASDRELAGSLASQVVGVRKVVNRLEIA